MNAAVHVLRAAHSVLVVDWPSRDVPETLARAGFTVIVRGGPGPQDYSAYERDETDNDRVVVRALGAAPDHVDLVYSHRPLAELPGIVALAQGLGAGTIWVQSGLDNVGARDPRGCWLPDDESRRAREIVDSAGLNYVEKPYISDAVHFFGQED